MSLAKKIWLMFFLGDQALANEGVNISLGRRIGRLVLDSYSPWWIEAPIGEQSVRIDFLGRTLCGVSVDGSDIQNSNDQLEYTQQVVSQINNVLYPNGNGKDNSSGS